MQRLTSALDLRAFFDRVRRAADRMLLLDYDGTLAPFTVDRTRAVPYPSVKALLPELFHLPNSRTIIISGRAVADLAGLVGVQPLPEIWGSHGWEHLSADGTYSLTSLDRSTRAVLRRAGEFLDLLNLPNLREDKPVSVAAHWRGLPTAEADSIQRQIRDAWTSLLGEAQLELHSFDGGLELRAKGRNKGSVVTEILAGHAADAAVAYLGDDLTDEDAFGALADKGLRVLVRPTLRDTLADLWLQPPDELIDFLVSWKEACSQPIRDKRPAGSREE